MIRKVFVEKKEEYVLEKVHTYLDLRNNKNALTNLELVMAKISVIPTVLAKFVQIVPMWLLDGASGKPLVYSAICEAFAKCKTRQIMSFSPKRLLLYITQKISFELISFFSLKLTCKDFQWDLKRAIYEDIAFDSFVQQENCEIDYVELSDKDAIQQSVDLSKKILGEQFFVDSKGRCSSKRKDLKQENDFILVGAQC